SGVLACALPGSARSRGAKLDAPRPVRLRGQVLSFRVRERMAAALPAAAPADLGASTGSTETIEWAAHPSRKYVYLQAYSPIQSVVRYLNYYREAAQRLHAYTASSDRICWVAPVFVHLSHPLPPPPPG